MEDQFLRGRQIAYMIYEYFRIAGTHEAVLDYSNLFSVTLHGDDVGSSFSISKRPPNDSILESLYKMRIRESVQLQTVLAMYEQEIHQDRSKSNDQKLKTMVRRHNETSKSETKELKQEYWDRSAA